MMRCPCDLARHNDRLQAELENLHAEWSEPFVDEAGTVSATRIVLNGVFSLTFLAKGCERRYEQVYARLEVWQDARELSWGVIALGNARARHELANAAWEQLIPADMVIYSRRQLQHDLDTFSRLVLEGAQQAQQLAQHVAPPSDRSPAQQLSATGATTGRPAVTGMDIPGLG